MTGSPAEPSTSRAIITGGASGIGLAVSELLTTWGWSVVCLDLVASPSPAVVSIVADVGREAVVRTAVEDAIEVLGGCDALVCAAGVSGSSQGDGPVASSSAGSFDAVVAVNLRGTFLACGAAWDALATAGGSVVTVASVLGLTGGGGPFRSHAYVASKGGLIALTRALAAEGRHVGINANCVAPGLVRTPMTSRVEDDPSVLAYSAQRQELVGGLMDPTDVAGLIAFLCTPGGRAITGQTIAVDAGWSLDPA